jgi:ATP synthase protein I
MGNMGKWAFIVGFVICIVAGLLIAAPWMYWVLAILGLIVGFMNVTASETKGFLLAAIGLMLSATSVVAIPMIGVAVTAVLYNIVTFISAAVLVVALKSLFEIAKD